MTCMEGEGRRGASDSVPYLVRIRAGSDINNVIDPFFAFT